MKINKNLLFTISLLTIVITGIVGYSYLNSDINSTSNVTINKYSCNQANLYDRLACMSVMDNVKSKYVSSSTGINFSTISSDTNGKGIYTFSSTAGDEYPIYYYRGEVDNNNVKFAGYCWKIIRTTDTGGTKILYSGEPDENGYCNKSDASTQLSNETIFNDKKTPTQAGYMYKLVENGTHLPNDIINNPTLFGNDIEYDNNTGLYTLKDTITTVGSWSADYENIANAHHYTCGNSSNTCNSVKYVYYVESTYGSYITFKNGEDIESRWNLMITPQTSSLAKEAVDTWFSQNLSTYITKLEDTVFCAELIRYKGGWTKDGNSADLTKFEARKRLVENVTYPEIKNCSANFSYTVDSSNGNGKLTYPAALITGDEILLAGLVKAVENKKNYLYNTTYWWGMTPIGWSESVSFVTSTGSLGTEGYMDVSRGIRPVISLNHSQVIASGDGTQNNPYVIN